MANRAVVPHGTRRGRWPHRHVRIARRTTGLPTRRPRDHDLDLPPTSDRRALTGCKRRRTRAQRNSCCTANHTQGLLFIDVETCCRGPIEFDFALGPATVNEHYGDLELALLAECRRLVLAMVAAWRWDRHDHLPNERAFGGALFGPALLGQQSTRCTTESTQSGTACDCCTPGGLADDSLRGPRQGGV